MQLKKITATMLITISGSLLSADAMSSRLEEVTVTGFSNQPTITSGSSGSGGLAVVNFNGSNPNFNFGNPNLDAIAEEERQRLEEEKKERDEKSKEKCVQTTSRKFRSCNRRVRTSFELRLNGCSNSINSASISLGPLGSIGFERTNRDLKCIQQNTAARATAFDDCETFNNVDDC